MTPRSVIFLLAMRYTTVIDISELQGLYRNKNARLVYLHLALKSGYHDDDRDTISVSIRSLARDADVSVSAVRHALLQLEKNGLLQHDGERWRVKKWILDTTPTPRPKKEQAKDITNAGQMVQRRDAEAEQYARKQEAAIAACTREELTKWIAELEEGRSLRHRGVSIKASENNINYMKSVLQTK